MAVFLLMIILWVIYIWVIYDWSFIFPQNEDAPQIGYWTYTSDFNIFAHDLNYALTGTSNIAVPGRHGYRVGKKERKCVFTVVSEFTVVFDSLVKLGHCLRNYQYAPMLKLNAANSALFIDVWILKMRRSHNDFICRYVLLLTK